MTRKVAEIGTLRSQWENKTFLSGWKPDLRQPTVPGSQSPSSLLATSCQLPTTSYRLQTTSYLLSAFTFQL